MKRRGQGKSWLTESCSGVWLTHRSGNALNKRHHDSGRTDRPADSVMVVAVLRLDAHQIIFAFAYQIGVESKGSFLGEFEQVVLLAVLRLADNAYGVTVRDEIEVSWPSRYATAPN